MKKDRWLQLAEMKQVIVFRSDLKLSKGKLAIQVAHAAVSASKRAEKNNDWLKEWEFEGQKKVLVKVKTKEELIELKESAKQKKLPYFLVKDAGLTEIPPNTITCLGIGPAPEEKIDEITGNLPLV